MAESGVVESGVIGSGVAESGVVAPGFGAPSVATLWLLALWPIGLFAAWTLAWIAALALRETLRWSADAETAYWIAAKLALWVAPVVIILRRRSIRVAAFVGLAAPARGVGIGLLADTGLLAFSLAMDLVLGSASFSVPVPDLALLNGALVAPMVEEFALRGFYLAWLERAGRPFGRANIWAGVVFVALHVPGWYFQGRLREPWALIQTAIFLWLLALLLGWIKKSSGSLYAAIAVHVLNNLYVAARG